MRVCWNTRRVTVVWRLWLMFRDVSSRNSRPRRGKIREVRLRTSVLIVLLACVWSACAPKTIPAPVVTSPKYPDFLRPVVPPTLAGTSQAMSYDRAWRFLQAGDLKNADREAAAALQASPGFYPAEAASGYIALARQDPKAALSHFDRTLERQPGYLSA